MEDKIFDELKDLINLIQENNKYQIEELEDIINDIVKYKETDQKLIEYTFDRMLSIEFISEEDIKIIYYKLLKYYKKLKKKVSDDYKDFFIEKFSETEEDCV